MATKDVSGSNVTVVQRDARGGAVSAARTRPQLRWSDASGPRSFAIEGRVTVGAASSVDLTVSDPAVSRLHMELDARDEGVWVRDLESRNGTYVENVQVQCARIPDGGRVRVGSTTFTLGYESTPQPVELWPNERFGPLLGRSVAMRELFARLARVAPTDSTVLIQGETGTGKELVAEAIHASSPRASQPFVIVDCGALPENLLESELFGHAKGAFTGAVSARAGAIEAADGGTVFLDEIGELPMSMQPKLLRAIESRAVRRIGESAYRKVNVRIISATHRDLRTMVNGDGFREDLYFRLAVLPVVIPPLRVRTEDIGLLVHHFLPQSAAGALPPEVVRDLSARPWFGNVRELRNFVERAIALGAQEALAMASDGTRRPGGDVREVGASVELDMPFKEIRERWLDRLEREYITGLLQRHHWNVSAVAQSAGLDRTYVHRLIRKHDIERA